MWLFTSDHQLKLKQFYSIKPRYKPVKSFDGLDILDFFKFDFFNEKGLQRIFMKIRRCSNKKMIFKCVAQTRRASIMFYIFGKSSVKIKRNNAFVKINFFVWFIFLKNDFM